MVNHCVVVGSAVLSVPLSPYSLYSLNQLRKDGIPFLLAFILLTNIDSDERKKTTVLTMSALICGYAVKEFLAL